VDLHSIFQDDLGQGEIAGVTDAQTDVLGSQALGMLARRAMENDYRSSARRPRHFDIAPAHASAPSGAQGFHGRLFGSKSCGVPLNRVTVTFAVSDLSGSEDALEETPAMPSDGFTDPGNLFHIYTQPENHCLAPWYQQSNRR
jgi:hypothetical protein